jgi:putative heme-binding domain-containing protein
LGGRRVTDSTELAKFSRWLVDTIVSGPAAAPPPSEPVLRAVFTAAQRLGVKEAVGVALAVVGDTSRPLALRRDAAATAIAIDRDRSMTVVAARLADPGENAAALVEFMKQLAALDHPQAREAIATALAAAPSTQQRELSLAALADRGAAERLVALVERGKVSARILTDPQIARRLTDVGLPDAAARIEALTAGLPGADDRIRDAIRQVSQRIARGEGDVPKGMAAFTRHCAACHRHRGFGGLVGPQLDGVAQRGAERLLEDILDPNRNVDEAFRTTVLELADGRVVSGLKVRDEGVDIVLVDAGGREVRVPRDQVEATTVQRVSPMPAALADQVGEEGLADLIAYLRAG